MLEDKRPGQETLLDLIDMLEDSKLGHAVKRVLLARKGIFARTYLSRQSREAQIVSLGRGDVFPRAVGIEELEVFGLTQGFRERKTKENVSRPEFGPPSGTRDKRTKCNREREDWSIFFSPPLFRPLVFGAGGTCKRRVSYTNLMFERFGASKGHEINDVLPSSLQFSDAGVNVRKYCFVKYCFVI
jgi:hypothetical protein